MNRQASVVKHPRAVSVPFAIVVAKAAIVLKCTNAHFSAGFIAVAVSMLHGFASTGVKCASSAAMANERKLLELLAQHPHTNILTVYGIVIDAADLKLVMQYCRGGSLDKHLAKVDGVSDCA